MQPVVPNADSPSTDAHLLIQIAQGDERALAELYRRYARVVHAIAHKSLPSTEECEEVVIEVFSQVWRIAERYDASKSRADTWLFMLTRSRTLDQLRKHQRRVATTELSPEEGQEIQLADAGVSPIEAAIIAERRQRVLAILATIPVEQRLVIELAYFQGLSQRQIANQTGMSLGTVKTRIRLGLSKLKGCLSPDLMD
jgi:RNA polymerase sigma-70 factor, ECF subfamily